MDNNSNQTACLSAMFSFTATLSAWWNCNCHSMWSVCCVAWFARNLRLPECNYIAFGVQLMHLSYLIALNLLFVCTFRLAVGLVGRNCNWEHRRLQLLKDTNSCWLLNCPC